MIRMFTIGKFAQAGGVGVETIRFYQRKGLLPTPVKTTTPRHYSEDDLDRLRFIRKAQVAGFTLQEIGELLELEANQDKPRVYQMTMARIDALETKIEELQQARNLLKKLAIQCSESTQQSCPILKSFE